MFDSQWEGSVFIMMIDNNETKSQMEWARATKEEELSMETMAPL